MFAWDHLMENTSLYESWCMSLIKIHRLQHTDTSLKQSYRVNDRSLTKYVTPLTLSESTLKLRKESDTVTMELCKSPDYSSLQIGNRRGEGNPLPLSPPDYHVSDVWDQQNEMARAGDVYMCVCKVPSSPWSYERTNPHTTPIESSPGPRYTH